MAKKTAKAPIKKAPIKTPSASKSAEVEAGINELQKAIGEIQTPPPVVEKVEQVEQIAAQVVEQTETPAAEVVEQVEQVEKPVVEQTETTAAEIVQETKPEIKTGLSIWDDVKKPTEEDANLGKGGDIAQALAEEANNETDFNNFTEEQANKQAYKVKAGIVVELLDVSFMIICCLIVWEFSDETQKKYTLNKDRKKAIQFNLYQLYCLQNKKVDPKKAIWSLILGSYVPMLIVALITMFNKFKKNKEEKERKKLEAERAEQQKEHIRIILAENEALRRQQIRDPKNYFQHNNVSNAQTVEPETIIQESKQKQKPKKTPVFIHTELKKSSGRGVKAGTKRGKYKK